MAEAGAKVDEHRRCPCQHATEGWWLLRASNTQDVLVARCEARDATGLESLRETLVAQLAASGIEAPEF